jgi:hypothetical protein
VGAKEVYYTHLTSFYLFKSVRSMIEERKISARINIYDLSRHVPSMRRLSIYMYVCMYVCICLCGRPTRFYEGKASCTRMRNLIKQENGAASMRRLYVFPWYVLHDQIFVVFHEASRCFSFVGFSFITAQTFSCCFQVCKLCFVLF